MLLMCLLARWESSDYSVCCGSKDMLHLEFSIRWKHKLNCPTLSIRVKKGLRYLFTVNLDMS